MADQGTVVSLVSRVIYPYPTCHLPPLCSSSSLLTKDRISDGMHTLFRIGSDNDWRSPGILENPSRGSTIKGDLTFRAKAYSTHISINHR